MAGNNPRGIIREWGEDQAHTERRPVNAACEERGLCVLLSKREERSFTRKPLAPSSRPYRGRGKARFDPGRRRIGTEKTYVRDLTRGVRGEGSSAFSGNEYTPLPQNGWKIEGLKRFLTVPTHGEWSQDRPVKYGGT